ncbi:MAG: hypothetical protein Q9162_004549 [Coniocarpon cinnabarinum]
MSPGPKKQSQQQTSAPHRDDVSSPSTTTVGQLPAPSAMDLLVTASPTTEYHHPAATNPASEPPVGREDGVTTNAPPSPGTSMGPPRPTPSPHHGQQQPAFSTPISESPAPIGGGLAPHGGIGASHDSSFPRPYSSPRGSSAGPAQYEQVRSPSGRSSLASTEQQSRSSRRESRSPEPGQRTSTSSAGAGGGADNASQTSARVRRRPKTQVASACWKCKKDHLSCDKRGRPKLDQRVDPEPSSTSATRKRPRHASFEIDPAPALPTSTSTESYGRQVPPPPSSYHWHQPSSASDPTGQRSSYSSIPSIDSGGPSSRPSHDSARSYGSQHGRGLSTRSNSTASSDPPPLHGYSVSPYSQPSPHVGRSPAAYNLNNLAASLPPSSPAMGTQFGLPTSHYRPQNPANPQNFGTRPRPAPAGPTSYPYATSRDPLRTASSVQLPPVTPFHAPPPPTGHSQSMQLPAMQPPVQLPAPDASASFSRGPPQYPPSHQYTQSPANMPSATSYSSSIHGPGRYDPVQEAARSREHREGRSHGSRAHDEGAGRSSRRNESDHSSGRSGNEGGNDNSRRQRRAVKLSDIVH